jgi:hypothetical protein
MLRINCIFLESVRRLKSLRPVILLLFFVPDDFAQCHPRLDLRDRPVASSCRKVWRSRQWNFVIRSFILPIADEALKEILKVFENL